MGITSESRIVTAVDRRNRTGSALLIVLAFIVLLTVLILGFFSRSILEQQVSNSSANQVKVDSLTLGAVAATVSDLKQEIQEGSTVVYPVTSPSVNNYIVNYAPTASAGTYATMLPAVTGSANGPAPGTAFGGVGLGSGVYRNLIKISMNGAPFYPGGSAGYDGSLEYSTRAAAVSTGSPASEAIATGILAPSSSDGTSINGRYINGNRWNKPLLLAPGTKFPLPDWIYVPRLLVDTNVNPTAWNANMKTAPYKMTTTTAVVGRYAYAIYDEGGLLDINVAGTPSAVTAANYGYKNALALADLRQLTTTGLPGGASCLTQAQIDTLVGWRNNASAAQWQKAGATTALGGNTSSGYVWAAANGTNYYLNILGNPLGFLRPTSATTSTTALTQSDQFFASRQQLIQFFNQVLGGSTAVQTALQYLTHFSRDLNQPAYAPPAARPFVLPAASGGSNAYVAPAGTIDNAINPIFPNVRAKTQFTRNDYTKSIVGEPLVKKRFNLNRIAWLTCFGPIADDAGVLSNVASSTTYVGATNAIALSTIITQLETTYGLPESFLRQGGPSKIYGSFGLAWDATNHRWNYTHGRNGDGKSITGAGALAPGAIMKLQYAADETGSTYDVYTAGREADFFELLKASIDVGAVAKTITTPQTTTTPGTTDIDVSWVSQYNVDSSVDFAIMQIGANIIDQFKVDNYPTRILFNDGSGSNTNLDSSTLATPLTYFTPATTSREFRGSKNLPYLYRLRSMFVKTLVPTLSGSVTMTTVVTTSPGGTSTYTPSYGAGSPYSTTSVDYPFATASGNSTTKTITSTTTGTTTTTKVTPTGANTLAITDTGLGAVLYVPELWNPHDYSTTNLSQTEGIVGPTIFRMYAVSDDATQVVIGSDGGIPATANNSIGSGVNYTLSPGSYYTLVAPPSGSPLASSGEQRGMTQAGTEMDFNIPANATGAALFREPVLCYQPGKPTGSNLFSVPFSGGNSLDGTLLGTTARTALNKLAVVPGVFAANGGLNSAVTDATSPTSTTLPTTGTGYIGFYVGCHPLLWTAGSTASTEYIYGPRQSGYMLTKGVHYYLQCQGPSGEWITYDEKYVIYPANSANDNVMQAPQTAFVYLANHGGINLTSSIDPRTCRFGFVSTFDLNGYNGLRFPPWTSAQDATTAWLNKGEGILASNRDGASDGLAWNNPDGIASVTGASTGQFAALAMKWYPGSISGGTVNFPGPLNPAAAASINLFRPGLFATNNKNVVPTSLADDQGDSSILTGTFSAQYYADPDGVVRRAMGGNDTNTTSGATAVTVPAAQPGQPQAIANTTGNVRDTASPSQSASRPMILNRPPRSVADLGYVFSGTPWKNLDMSNPESGYSALLDVFCVGEPEDPGGLVAGKVNLNTRQPLVLQSILTGAYRDEINPGGSNIDTFGTAGSSTSVAYLAANVLVTRTASTTSGKGPLTNISELVGRFVPTTVPALPIDGTSNANYSGFSGDLTTSVLTTPTSDAAIPRYRDATIRALANTGQTRVWNLLIDVVAQTGRFPSTASTLANFYVEGEQRYWVHLAIDRLTGQVIDQQIEVVKE